MKLTHIRALTAGLAFAVAIAIGLLGPVSAAMAVPETFSATASIDSPSGQASVPVEIKIDRFTTDAERDKIVAVVKANDAAKTIKALEQQPDAGTLTFGGRVTAIKYAYARATGDGRLVTLVTARPVLFVGAGLPDAKPKTGHDLAIALLMLDGKDTGVGEIALAANVKVTESGALQTDDYGRETVRLTKIAKKR